MNFDYKRLVKFEHNIGLKDKKVRMWSGVVLLVASLFTASVLMLLVGLALTATSYFGWCPAYSGFGHNTLCGETPAGNAAASDSNTDAH